MIQSFIIRLLAATLVVGMFAHCGNETPEEVSTGAVREIYAGEGFRIELRDESYTWNTERSARSLSAEIWLVIDPTLPAEQRPSMLHGTLFLDVDASGEYSKIDGGTAGILDDPLRDAFALVPADLNEVKLGPITQTGVRPIDPPAWRGSVRLPNGEEAGASIRAEAIE
jgi:hypothetical protein